jgi:hypothetical protein
VDLGRLGTAVGRRDPDENVVRGRLRILDDHVEVAVRVEDAGIHQLVPGSMPVAPAVRLDEPGVREAAWGYFGKAAWGYL